MPLRINDPEVEHLVRALVEKTGEAPDKAIARALRESLERVADHERPTLADELDEIGKRCAALPDVDTRSPDEILGYDEDGLPT
ncbi:MAG TPA: type II toxin-antitoxin system VapB family antitoxin [Terriglobales bacterium]|nr:type II toxin-antitoxin system VapB family antitoxin [Terriglobales bacterium]